MAPVGWLVAAARPCIPKLGRRAGQGYGGAAPAHGGGHLHARRGRPRRAKRGAPPPATTARQQLREIVDGSISARSTARSRMRRAWTTAVPAPASNLARHRGRMRSGFVRRAPACETGTHASQSQRRRKSRGQKRLSHSLDRPLTSSLVCPRAESGRRAATTQASGRHQGSVKSKDTRRRTSRRKCEPLSTTSPLQSTARNITSRQPHRMVGAPRRLPRMVIGQRALFHGQCRAPHHLEHLFPEETTEKPKLLRGQIRGRRG